jgi:hypothetical protein
MIFKIINGIVKFNKDNFGLLTIFINDMDRPQEILTRGPGSFLFRQNMCPAGQRTTIV